MAQLFFDIETVPDGDKPTEDEVKIHGNIKQPDAQQIAYDRAIETAYRKYSLIAYKGRILCIGGILELYEKDDVEFLVYGDSNEEVITNYYKILLSHLTPKDMHSLDYIGYNIIDFDMKWIFLQTLKYLPEYKTFVPNRGHRTIDLMKEFTYGSYKDMVKMKAACEFFGIKSKAKGIDGSMVYDMYLEGKSEEIYDYCLDDVKETRKLYYKMFPK